MQTIIIVGAGWYGCHIAKILQHRYNVIIIEKSDNLFSGSSFFNQNRLHIGYHYCRDFSTRSLCKDNYNRFKLLYPECIDDIKDNYYMIAKKSIIDYNTYLSIYKYENFDFQEVETNDFKNIQGNVLNVDEKVINSEKIKEHFKSVLTNVRFLYNTTVSKIDETLDGIIVNNEYKCDYLFDCTFNQMGLDKTQEYIYELTLSLMYEKDGDFGSLTVMDGNFCSLYPRYDNKYTLTDVEYTPLKISKSFEDVASYIPTEEEILIVRRKMENKLISFYPKFYNNFLYHSYFLSFKTKMISSSDSRNITITNLSKRIVSVNCGKIYGIFEWEDHILKFLDSIDTNKVI